MPSASRICSVMADRLGRTREDAAAGRDQRRCRSRPTRSAAARTAVAARRRRWRHPGRVHEDVPMVERRHQPDVLGQQHAVAEHVAGHVSDADAGEVGGLGVDAQFSEVVLDRLPGTPGGDAHALVVVPGAAAGGECVAEPEAPFDRERRWRCRRTSLCPCPRRPRDRGRPRRAGRRNRRWYDRAVDPVVGQVEQPGDEQSVAGDTFGLLGLPVGGRVAGGRRVAGARTKPPLAPTGTITAFFTSWALTRPRISVRKSSGRSDQRRPPAGDRAESEVHPFQTRRVHPDLVRGNGFRHTGNPARDRA